MGLCFVADAALAICLTCLFLCGLAVLYFVLEWGKFIAATYYEILVKNWRMRKVVKNGQSIKM